MSPDVLTKQVHIDLVSAHLSDNQPKPIDSLIRLQRKPADCLWLRSVRVCKRPVKRLSDREAPSPAQAEDIQKGGPDLGRIVHPVHCATEVAAAICSISESLLEIA